jgi:hypothetical protein
MRRAAATVVSVLAVAAVLSPALHERDSYPLSTYPMFSYDRGRLAVIDTAVGWDTSGRRRRLNPTLIAGGIEVIRAAVTVSRSIRNGDTDVLCAEIAERAAGRLDLVRVEVVSETHDVVSYFADSTEPLAVTVHASCPVSR